MRTEFIAALQTHQAEFGIDLTAGQATRLADFYDLVQEHNPILHLVGTCTPEEFAVRHVLESLTLLKFLSHEAKFADIGPGAGFPSIPCLIVREGLHAVLIESKEKKSSFLHEAAEKCGISDRVEIFNRQFSELKRPEVGYVTCRALDKFAQRLPQLLKWARGCDLLFFGGPSLASELAKRQVIYTEHLLPMSQQRYLFAIA